ncbi:MAG: hypothetical protein Kow00117_08620 [Phototrophicales bacterium]
MIRKVVLICLFVLLNFGVINAQEEDQETRTFYMGFTPFPYAITLEAVHFTYSQIAQDADLIVHHFDSGVPWTEALHNQPYHPNMMNDWEFRRSQVPENHKLLVTVTPISISRDSLAPYRGEAESMPLPPPFDSYNFDHPDVIQAFTNYCRTTIDYFQPDYFVFGIEVNLLIKLRPELWDAYMVLHQAVYDALKADYPDLPIMVSLTGIDLLPGYTDADPADQARALDDILPYTDYVGYSVYPFMTAFLTDYIPDNMFDELANLTNKPIAITETGYPAQSFRFNDGITLNFESNEGKQADYIQYLLESAQTHQFVFVVNFVLRDYDDLWLEIGGQEDLTILWRDTGLYSETGDEREALTIWRDWLALPVNR